MAAGGGCNNAEVTERIQRGATIMQHIERQLAVLASLKAAHPRRGRYDAGNTRKLRAANAELVRLRRGLLPGEPDPSAVELPQRSEADQQASIALHAGHLAAATAMPTGRAPTAPIIIDAAGSTTGMTTAASGATGTTSAAAGSRRFYDKISTFH